MIEPTEADLAAAIALQPSGDWTVSLASGHTIAFPIALYGFEGAKQRASERARLDFLQAQGYVGDGQPPKTKSAPASAVGGPRSRAASRQQPKRSAPTTPVDAVRAAYASGGGWEGVGEAPEGGGSPERGGAPEGWALRATRLR